MTYLQLQTEGLFWNSNLIQPDPYFILPVTLFVSTYLFQDLIQLSIGRKPTSFFLKVFSTIFRFSAVLFLIVGAIVPSVIFFYYFSHSYKYDPLTFNNLANFFHFSGLIFILECINTLQHRSTSTTFIS